MSKNYNLLTSKNYKFKLFIKVYKHVIQWLICNFYWFDDENLKNKSLIIKNEIEKIK